MDDYMTEEQSACMNCPFFKTYECGKDNFIKVCELPKCVYEKGGNEQ